MHEAVAAYREMREAEKACLNPVAAGATAMRPSQDMLKRIAQRNKALLEHREEQLQTRRAQQASAERRFAPPPRVSTAYSNVESRFIDHAEARVEKARSAHAEEVGKRA